MKLAVHSTSHRIKSGQVHLFSYSKSLIVLKELNYISKHQVLKSEVLFLMQRANQAVLNVNIA